MNNIVFVTLLLKSPTTTKNNKKELIALAEIGGIDYNICGLDMLKAGIDSSSFLIEEILPLDDKRIDLKEVKSAIVQVNTDSIEDAMKIEADLTK